MANNTINSKNNDNEVNNNLFIRYTEDKSLPACKHERVNEWKNLGCPTGWNDLENRNPNYNISKNPPSPSPSKKD